MMIRSILHHGGRRGSAVFAAAASSSAGAAAAEARTPSSLPSFRGVVAQQVRSISVGTDMISTVISLQKARPWYNSDSEGSNLAVDNAVTLKDLFQNRTVAFFGVPAPFTGTCTRKHYPGYKELAGEILGAGGADEIVCYSVTDPYAHRAWSRSLDNDDGHITFLADPDGSFARAYGVDANYDAASLGDRSKRFSMVVVDGKVMNFRVVEDALKDAETLLGELKELKEHGK